jgi:ribosomal protein S18 acetylase RimI-like enzyme
LRFRPAQASDADACAPLIFASGTGEFRFYLGQSDPRCIAFLRHAFTLKHSRYSWRRYYVACAPDDTALCVMGAHHHQDTRLDDLHESWLALRFFGPLKAPALLRRGLALEHELPAPQRGQTLLASFATAERVRGTGIFTSMLTHALTSGWLRHMPDSPSNHQYVLDVLLTNTRARHLYERLGFTAQQHQRPPSPRLPAELTAMRMAWSAEGMAALRAPPD